MACDQAIKEIRKSRRETVMGGFRDKLNRMMYGRYGSDQLSRFCFVLYLVIWVVGLFIRVPQVRIGLNLFSYVIIFVYFFRFAI